MNKVSHCVKSMHDVPFVNRLQLRLFHDHRAKQEQTTGIRRVRTADTTRWYIVASSAAFSIGDICADVHDGASQDVSSHNGNRRQKIVPAFGRFDMRHISIRLNKDC